MEAFTIEEHTNANGVKIVVVGVGGGGCNMVDSLAENEIADHVKLVAVNTDKQALDKSHVPNKLQIGENITRGKGSGMNPDIGKASALENYDQIKEMLFS